MTWTKNLKNREGESVGTNTRYYIQPGIISFTNIRWKVNGSAAVLEKDLGVMEGHSLDMGQYHAVKKTNGKLAWIKKCITCMT